MNPTPATFAAILLTALSTHAAPPPTTQPTPDYSSEHQRSRAYNLPRTAQSLNRIIKALAIPATRLAALRELIDFAGSSAYRNPSLMYFYKDHTGKIREQAADLATAAADNSTILQSLKGSDPILKFWGIWHFHNLKNPHASLPLLEKIAQAHDQSLRGEAVERLQEYPTEKSFIQNLAPTEKSPFVLDQILFAGNPTGIPAFNQRLLTLLKDPDPAVRKNIIGYLSINQFSAASRQTFIDAPLMDALLACAQTKNPEATIALATFTTLANADLPSAPAAAAWWKKHRTDWQLARIPRGTQPNGPLIFPSITTTGQVYGTPNWHASITLKNISKKTLSINLSEISTMDWSLYNTKGERIQMPSQRDQSAPDWRQLKPGQSITQPAPIDLNNAGVTLTPGNYTLKACIELGTDHREEPSSIPSYSGELPLPAITIQVPATK